MIDRTYISTSFLLLLSFWLAACARPVMVMQTSSSDLDLEVDAYVQTNPDLEIAYDFWSPDGVPFISFLNNTEDTILLDLDRSKLMLIQQKRTTSLEEAIQDQTGFESYKNLYPDLQFKRENRRMHLVLSPHTWSSLYGPTFHSTRATNRGASCSLVYVYTIQDSTKSVVHDFELSGLTKISRKEVSSYERTEAKPNQYFIDKGFNANTAILILDILIAVYYAL